MEVRGQPHRWQFVRMHGNLIAAQGHARSTALVAPLAAMLDGDGALVPFANVVEKVVGLLPRLLRAPSSAAVASGHACGWWQVCQAFGSILRPPVQRAHPNDSGKGVAPECKSLSSPFSARPVGLGADT